MTQLLDEAVDALERRLFFEELAGRYSDIREDPARWRQVEAEREIESATLSDGSA